ncbi:hypothetical protein HDV57DRAFT_435635 [Trichoderma longibrachiatum]
MQEWKRKSAKGFSRGRLEESSAEQGREAERGKNHGEEEDEEAAEMTTQGGWTTQQVMMNDEVVRKTKVPTSSLTLPYLSTLDRDSIRLGDKSPKWGKLKYNRDKKDKIPTYIHTTCNTHNDFNPGRSGWRQDTTLLSESRHLGRCSARNCRKLVRRIRTPYFPAHGLCNPKHKQHDLTMNPSLCSLKTSRRRSSGQRLKHKSRPPVSCCSPCPGPRAATTSAALARLSQPCLRLPLQLRLRLRLRW